MGGYGNRGYAGLGYAGLGYAGLGYGRLGYSGLLGARGYYGKRDADAEADPQYLASTYAGYSGYGLGYSGYPYSGAYGYGNLGYAGYGYSGLGYSGLLGARGYYGKRDADAEADPQYLAGYTNAGYGYAG